MAWMYFALGTTLANLKNVEDIVGLPPHVLPNQAVPLTRPNARRTLSGAVVRNGAIATPLQWDVLRQRALRDLIALYWPDGEASAPLYASWLDETGRYSPFAVVVSRPQAGEDYEMTDSVWARAIRLPAFNWTLQSVTKTTSATLTASDRLVYCNTSSATVTLTLPAANAVNPNTVLSVVKTVAANQMIVQRSGSDTLDGGVSVTYTAAGTRADMVSNGVNAWRTIYA